MKPVEHHREDETNRTSYRRWSQWNIIDKMKPVQHRREDETSTI